MSVGYPHPEVELRLVDGDNRDAEQGVLEMKCPAMMNGYHNRPDLQPPFTADGFYITGDVFRRDADGFHYFVGRTDDMFVSGGENIYPADVERMLERHPEIAQAAVVPIEDEIKGQKPVAFVIRKPGHAARARTRSSALRSPTRPPTSIRASSGSSTSCRSPRPTRSTRAALRPASRAGARSAAHANADCSLHLEAGGLDTGAQRAVSSAMKRCAFSGSESAHRLEPGGQQIF